MSAQKSSVFGAVRALLGFVAVAAAAGVLATLAVTPAIALTGVAASNSIGMFTNQPDALTIGALPQKTTVYAKRGGQNVPIASFFAENRVSVGWDQISQYVKDAAVTGEDARFYEHGGIDPLGVLRAAAANLLGSNVQGASTITQQYVKNVQVQQATALADPAQVEAAYLEATKVTLGRKAKEMRLAIGLEKQYSKNDILLGYLNIALFGGRVYGIQAASQYYYGVNASDLTVAQAASLVAIVNSPQELRLDQPASTTNGAANGYAATKQRRDYILGTMLKYSKISQAQYAEALATPITPSINAPTNGCVSAGNAAYFCDYVVNLIRKDPVFGDTAAARYSNFIRGGFSVYTTLDLDLQDAAQNAINANVPKSMKGVDIGSASTSVQAGTGKILTMAQNKDFNDSGDPNLGPNVTAINYNTNTDSGGSSGFQAASTYKVFTLIAWLRAGRSLNERLNVSERNWDISTFPSCDYPATGTQFFANDAKESGIRTVMEATAQSINGGFIAMGQQLNQCDIRKAATDLMVTPAGGGQLMDNVAAILGTNNVSPLTMATAYAGIANGGKVCSAVAIERMVKPDGTDAAVPQTTCKQGIEPNIAAAAAYALKGVIEGGSATASNPNDRIQHFAKTGTSDGNQQTWTTGASSKVGLAVWVGQVTGSADLRKVFLDSGQAATARHRIWKPTMTALDAKLGGDPFPTPDRTLVYGAQYPVPDVQGQTLSQAQNIIEAAGFTFQDGGTRASKQPVGTVIAANPGAGTLASKGTTVTVYTSDGKLSGVAMPNVVGQARAAATSAVQSAGFTGTVNTTWVQGAAGNECKVTASDPPAGATAAPDAPVTLTVSGLAKAAPDGSFAPPNGTCP